MRRWMTAMACAAAMGVAACSSELALLGSGGSARFAALQATCGASTDYGADAPSVYATLHDAYIAYRHDALTPADYCAFQNDIARHYRARAQGGPDAQRAWADYFNAQRVKAIDWRAPVDPTLRGGG